MEIFGNKNIDPVKRYGWANVDPKWPGEFRLVPLKELIVDHSYQRAPGGEKNINETADLFDWIAFGCVVAMQRKNNTLYVIDGQQRVLAAKKREDIENVPCIIFRSPSSEMEAREFININTRRKNVTAYAKFRAACFAGMQPERTIAEWISSIGLKVENGAEKNNIEFAHVLVMTWKYDDANCREAILIQRAITPNEQLHSSIHKGLWWLLREGVDVREHVRKLMIAGGKPALLAAIKRMSIETNTPESVAVCGRGILALINKRLRNKIKIASLSDGKTLRLRNAEKGISRPFRVVTLAEPLRGALNASRMEGD